MGVTNHSPLYAAVLRGEAWTVSFNAVDPTDTDDHFLHIKNNSGRTFGIGRMSIGSTAAGTIEVYRATGTATTPTAIVPVPMGNNLNTPVGTYESGADLQMTTGVNLFNLHIGASTQMFGADVEGFFIPNATGIVFNWDAATGVLSGYVAFYWLPANEEN